MKLVCKKEFKYEDINGYYIFRIGGQYEYWSNFGGLNHFLKDQNGRAFPFDDKDNTDRPYIYEYFKTIEEYREDILNKIL